MKAVGWASVVNPSAAARRMITENDGLLVMRNDVHAERPSECAELQRLIAEAVATSSGKDLSPAGGLFVTRKNSGGSMDSTQQQEIR